MNTKLKFAFEKETKGAVRYQEVGEDAAPAFAPQVGTLYVRKNAMPGGKSRKHLLLLSQANNLIGEARVERPAKQLRVMRCTGVGRTRLAGYMARVGRL
jgi:hypothetical protein